MQQSAACDEEFGWDCMLGKLCRLAKRCRRASTLDAASDPAAVIGQPKFVWDFSEFYVKCSTGVVRVAKKQQLNSLCCHAATSAVKAVTVESIAKAQRGGSRFAFTTYSLRHRRQGVRSTPSAFVAIVKIEENLAHVATMAGMASGDIRASDSCGHLCTQIVDKLFDEFSVGSKPDERWNVDRCVGSHEQSGACRVAAKLEEEPYGPAELLVAIDDDERVRAVSACI
jgi:hypothetical protein